MSCAKMDEPIEMQFHGYTHGTEEPRTRWGPDPRGRGIFGGHTLPCPDLPSVEILNFSHQWAAAMRSPVDISVL